MNNQQPYNEFKGGLPIPIPPPADAWNDMRKRLDDEMPDAGVIVPGNIVTAGTGFINGVTALFALLLTGTVLWFGIRYIAANTGNKQPQAVNSVQGRKPDDTLTTGKAAPVALNTSRLAKNTPALLYSRQNSHTTQASVGKKGMVISSAPAAQNTVATNQPPTPVAPGYYTDSAKSSALNTTNKPVSQPAANTPPKQPGAPINDTAKDKEHKVDKVIVYAGLQWKSQVPPGSSQNYFTGPNASAQAYRVLLPGIWAGVEYDKNFLTGEINPFASTLYNPRPITATRPGAKELSKTFGITAALRYDYNFGGHWWAGGGVQAYWMSKGIGIQKRDSLVTLNSVVLTNDDFQYLSKFQIRTDAEVFYQSIRWHAGLRAGVYFTPIANSYSSLKNPLEVELFYRRILWVNRRKTRH